MRRATPHDVTLGRRIRAQRLSHGLSQEELAEGLGITFQQLQKYEKGSNRISATRLHEISVILQVPISAWFADEDGTSRRGRESTDAHEFITSARAIRLLRSFSQIEDAKVQNMIADLCEKLADKSSN